jgi:HK97 family phage portal protein
VPTSAELPRPGMTTGMALLVRRPGSGMRISADSVKRLSTVIACVGAKARAIGVLPCLIYSDLPGGGKKVVKQHPLFAVLHSRPNSMQDAFEFYQMLQGHVELRGNAFAEILSDSRGVIQELLPMHPDRVRVEMLSNGRLRYVYNDPLTNQTRILLQDEVFHLRDWADHAQVGQSRITMGMDVFGVALAQQDYVGKYMKNDAAAGMIVTGANFKTKAEEEAYVKEIERSSTGENRHRVRMLPPGVGITQIGVKPIDMQLLEARKASAVEICSMFNVLPHLVGVDAGKAATYASVEQFNLMHAQQCVLPMAVMWEQAIQRDLIQDDQFYAKFSLASLLRGDYATRMVGYATAIEHGWLSPDEARELEDMNPIPGGIGSKFFRPLNWTTLDAPANAGKSSAQQTGPAEEDDEQAAEDGSGADPGQQSRLQGTLMFLAEGSASRCVRREVNGMRRLIENQASMPDIDKFYAEQARFVCEVFRLDAKRQMRVKQSCDSRKYEFMQLFGEEDLAGALALVERIALTEGNKLAALAVEGVI